MAISKGLGSFCWYIWLYIKSLLGRPNISGTTANKIRKSLIL